MIGQTVNNYTIESVIGVGGMGTVYLARHKYLDNYSAIKVLHPNFSRNLEFKNRFINEAIALSKLNSPYIIKIKDFFDFQQNLFLVMEYVKGVELGDYIEKIHGPIPERRAREIFRKILVGVNDAHAKGVIHRDIKPSNILLESDDTPKILDFGIAKILDYDHKLTKPGNRMGSIIFMSPEQILGKELDNRTDIYSLGLTLYEILTGRNPYDKPNATEYSIHSEIVNGELPSPREYYPHISEEIEKIILKACAKDRDDRYNGCEEFINDILNYEASGEASDDGHLFRTQILGNEIDVQPLETSNEIFTDRNVRTVILPSQASKSILRGRRNIYGLSALFIILLIIVVGIYYSLNNESDPVIKEVKTESPQKQTKTIEKNTIKTEETKSQENEKRIEDSSPKKRYSSPKKNYESSPTPKRPRTTFEN